MKFVTGTDISGSQGVPFDYLFLPVPCVVGIGCYSDMELGKGRSSRIELETSSSEQGALTS